LKDKVERGRMRDLEIVRALKICSQSSYRELRDEDLETYKLKGNCQYVFCLRLFTSFIVFVYCLFSLWLIDSWRWYSIFFGLNTHSLLRISIIESSFRIWLSRESANEKKTTERKPSGKGQFSNRIERVKGQFLEEQEGRGHMQKTSFCR